MDKLSQDKEPRFILELPIKTTISDDKALWVKLEAARQLYNACLGQCLKRMDLMRRDPLYLETSRLDKSEFKSIRNQNFKLLNQKYGFNKYDMQKYMSKVRVSWIKDHVGSHIGQRISDRAFDACHRHLIAKGGKPYFKAIGELESFEGKNNVSDIVFDVNKMTVHIGHRDNVLSLLVMLKKNDFYAMESLPREVCYCRVVRKFVKNKYRYYLQLILKGTPPKKIPKVKEGPVGLDIGPSTIAVVSKHEVFFGKFCPELDNLQSKKRRLQRKMDRQRRSNNPNKYNTNSTVNKSNRDKWIKSKGHIKIQNKLREINRIIAKKRQHAHSLYIKYILENHGSSISTEKISYRAFQRNFGKSVGIRAPGKFLSMLRWKARVYGVALNEFRTHNTKCSQYCHVCDTHTKKPLSQRIHSCCSLNINRDIYSAFLSMNVVGDMIDKNLCAKNFEDIKAKLSLA